MKTVILDADLRARLCGGTAKVTITDEAGNSVGHYLPDDLYRSICEALLPTNESDRADARDEFRREKGATTTQLLADLRASLARWDSQP